VASDPGGNVWAVGSFSDGSDNLSLIERFDGAGWTRVAGDDFPASGNVLLGVSSAAGGDVWAVGYWYLSAPRGPAEPLIEHWDGVTWSRVSAPDTDAESGAQYLEGVAALPRGPAWAAGTGTQGGVLDRTCPVQLTDSGFSPGRPSVSFGDTVAWSVPSADGEPHSVTDASGLGLFDSGTLSPGTSFTFTLSAAGMYRQVDSETGHAGEVGVVPAAEPSSGRKTTTFTVTWAAGPAAAGSAYDVQVRRPGGGRFVAWKTGVAVASATFVADGGTGTYSFRARLRGAGGTTGWSPSVSIVVT
jgi:plastocyanin